MTRFFVQAYSTYRGLFLWLSWWGFTSNVFIAPLLATVNFALVSRFAHNPEGVKTIAVGMVAFSIPTILLGGIVQSFNRDRMYGTLSILYTSPCNRVTNYFSRGLLHFPNALLSAGSALVFATLILRIDLADANWPAVVCLILLMTLSCTMFALFVGNFAIVVRSWVDFFRMTGAVIPVTEFPNLLYVMARGLPLTNGLIAFRGVLNGAALSSVGGFLFWEAIVGLGYAVAGVLLFRLVERSARQSGAFEAEI